MNTVQIARSLGVSPESRIVSGYSGQHRALATMDARWAWQVLHPLMKLAHVCMYFSHPDTRLVGVDADGLPILVTSMGVGGAGRKTGAEAVANFWSRNSRTYLPGRPSRSTPEGRAWLLPGMSPIAYPGGSNHEADTWDGWCMAVDNVGWEDRWMAGVLHLFGLRDFRDIGNEWWHTQFAGYGASKSALQRDLRAKGLPVIDLPPIPLAAGGIEPDPPTAADYIGITDGDRGTRPREVQAALAAAGHDPGPLDGWWGARSKAALDAFRDARGITGTGPVTEADAIALGLIEPDRATPDTDDPYGDTDMKPYLQLPPATLSGAPWFYIHGGNVRVATARDVDDGTEKFIDDDPAAADRYQLLHRSVLDTEFEAA